MKMFLTWRLPAAFMVLALLVGCESAVHRDIVSTETVSNKAYIEMTEEERVAYDDNIKKEGELTHRKNKGELMAGRLVYAGNSKNPMTISWDPWARVLYVFRGHKRNVMDIKTDVVVAVATDPAMEPLYDDEGNLVVVAGNVATEQGDLRYGLGLAAQVLGPFSHGALAAEISKCDGGDCGGGATAISLSESFSRSEGTGSAVSSTYTGCGGDPTCRGAFPK